MIVLIVLVAVLAIALILVSVNLFTFFHMTRALLFYFKEQMPDADTMSSWIKWSTKNPIKKPFLMIHPGGPPEPPRADNHRRR